MLAALLLTAAMAAEPVVPTEPDLGSEDRRLLRQGRQLRTIGVTSALVGPPAIGIGWAMAARGAARNQDGLALGGVALGAAGGLATIAGVPLLLGGGAVGRHLRRRTGRPGRSPALPAAAGTLFVGSGALLIAGGFDGPAWPTWTAAGLYTGGLTLAWIDAEAALSVGGRPVAVAPWVERGHVTGVVVSGRL